MNSSLTYIIGFVTSFLLEPARQSASGQINAFSQ